MACTQLVVIDQPKKEHDDNVNLSLRSPYDHPEVVKTRIAAPIAIGLAQLAQLVYGKQ